MHKDIEMKLNLNWQWDKYSLLLLIMILVVPLIQSLQINPAWINYVEDSQTLFLLFCFLFTLICTLTSKMQGSKYVFWLWASLWWLVLLGRDQNWGRQTIPGFPLVIYHTIGWVLISSLIVMLFCSRLRTGIKECFQQPFPVWNFILATISFLLADAVERGRWIAHFVLYQANYDELVEELYEVPFMLALFSVSVILQLRDIKQARNKNKI